MIFLMPVSALFGAWIDSQVWHYFLATQYGSGPSFQAWFGISVLAFLMTLHLPSRNDTQTKDSWLVQSVEGTVRAFLISLGVLLMALFIRAVLGWW